MSYMTDTGRAAGILNYLYTGAAAPSWPTTPFKLKLLTAMGSGNGNVNGTNGTENTGSGYTAGGASMGASPTFATFGTTTATSAGNSNGVSWNATGTWSTIVGIEIWDSAGTPLRWMQGALTSNITGVASGDTVNFAVNSITVNAAAW